MKVIFRADDVGYTDICNIGAFKTMDEGVVSLAEVMMDTPGAEDALQKLKYRPWITINWHTHFWGKPVAGADKVPSLVKPNGEFRDNLTFQKDLNYDELVTECRAEVEKCIRIYGKAPYATSLKDDVVGRAKRTVCDEYGIQYGYERYWHYGPEAKGHKPGINMTPFFQSRYEHLKIFEYENFGRPGLTFETYRSYDPLEMIQTMPLDTDNIWIRSQHPGYVDDYILRQTIGNPLNTTSIHRLKDVQVLCSDELKQWIAENDIEIINLRDAIEGTCEYQNHLTVVREQNDLLVKK